MTQRQIDYYNSLPKIEQQVLQLCAIYSRFDANSSIKLAVSRYTGKVLVCKEIEKIIDKAVNVGLFRRTTDYRIKYHVEIPFLVFVFPKIKMDIHIWREARRNDRDRGYWYSDKLGLAELIQTLHALLYDQKKYPEREKELSLSFFDHVAPEFFSEIIRDDQYLKYLQCISPDIFYVVFEDIIRMGKSDLTPWSEMAEKIERIKEKANFTDGFSHVSVKLNALYWKADFDTALALVEPNDILGFDFLAMKNLMDDNPSEALKYFEKSIKIQHKNGNKVPLPAYSDSAFFYLLTLLQVDAAHATRAFQKIVAWDQKRGLNGAMYVQFVAIALDFLHLYKENLQTLKVHIKEGILLPPSYFSLLDILIYYVLNEKIEPEDSSLVYDTIREASDGGYLLMAYEAAYAATKWFSEQRFDDLYAEISRKMKYQPVLSRIGRQEDWEKSLNLLFGLKSMRPKKSSEGNQEKKERVVYYFSPKNGDIQPVLQTQQVRGWSKGRNIALRSFYKKDVKGMTEQDLRVAQHLKMDRGYYNDTQYRFDEKAFVELIGHPHIFLNGTHDVPVEFIAGEVVVLVKKHRDKYQFETNPKDFDRTVFLEKETNTRYQVFNLSANTLRIGKIINEEKITVPEAGKEKLIELLGVLSAEGFAVHSDLYTTQNQHVEVKEVKPDSRIRVQLLPYGDGLRAELYAKPFGDRPPYCKAGKGGKALVSTEKDVQLQVKRELALEKENEQKLMEEIQSLETLNSNDDLLSFDDPMDSLYLLDILKDKQDICVVEWAEGERYTIRGAAGINSLHLKVKSGQQWFDLEGELRVDEHTVVSLQQLLLLTEKSKNRFIELSSGEFLALSDRLKKQLDALRLFADNNKKGVRLNRFASVGMGDFFDEIAHLKTDKKWKEFRKNLEKANAGNAEIPITLNADLRPYQEEGFQWMARLAQWHAGACLADDMGLGKTMQTLGILLHRASLGPALVVCPVSVVNNWIAEAERFAPTLRCKVLGGNGAGRESVMASLEAGDVLVTSYGLLQSEGALFAKQEFATAVLDEAHIIKNYATKTSKATMQLQADFRIALTGTPLQNNLGEIWNLFNFINPGLLGSMQHFNDSFLKSESERARKHLKNLIAPFILRRTKSAVLDELPPKTEIVKKITLSEEETAFYEALRRQALTNLENADEGQHIQALAEITRLRQASCNPLLVDKNLKIPSSKLATFVDITSELIANHHRALVFSQFVSHLAIVRKELDRQGITYQYIDGSTSQRKREQAVKKFQGGEGELFLISLKAGGLGLNLTAADYVLHLDPWWNPAVEDQASDRAHRIGQQRPVTVYRLVAENTIEEKILRLHAQKRDLAEQLLEGSDTASKLSVKEIIALISEGGGL